jgi:general secretion pathway protein D
MTRCHSIVIGGVILFGVWLVQPEGLPRAAAQQALGGQAGLGATEPPAPARGGNRGEEQRNRGTEQKLRETRVDFELPESSLEEALEYIASVIDVQIHVLWQTIPVEDEAKISMTLKDIRAELLLEMVLDQFDAQLSWTIRDGIVIIASEDEFAQLSTVRVYNVKDIIRPLAALDGGADPYGSDVYSPATGGGRLGPVGLPRATGAGMSDQDLGMGGGGMGGMGGYPNPAPTAPIDNLIRVIVNTIEPDSWQEVGGSGTLENMNDMLVINHEYRVHHQIERLLENLREHK